MALIDLSHEVVDGMTTYPGLPPPRVDAFFDHEESRPHYAPGTVFHIGRIDMVGNTGTYLDAPFHRHPGGADLADLALAQVADLPGVLVDARHAPGRELGPGLVASRAVAGCAVLFHTGWDRHWGTDAYFGGHPYLGAGLIEALVAGSPALVGIDSLNVDDTGGGERPAHTALLGAGVLVVEHLCRLGQLDPDRPFRLHAVPVPVRGMGTFPVRAYALQEGAAG